MAMDMVKHDSSGGQVLSDSDKFFRVGGSTIGGIVVGGAIGSTAGPIGSGVGAAIGGVVGLAVSIKDIRKPRMTVRPISTCGTPEFPQGISIEGKSAKSSSDFGRTGEKMAND